MDQQTITLRTANVAVDLRSPELIDHIRQVEKLSKRKLAESIADGYYGNGEDLRFTKTAYWMTQPKTVLVIVFIDIFPER